MEVGQQFKIALKKGNYDYNIKNLNIVGFNPNDIKNLSRRLNDKDIE
jgi:hypothetical protein